MTTRDGDEVGASEHPPETEGEPKRRERACTPRRLAAFVLAIVGSGVLYALANRCA